MTKHELDKIVELSIRIGRMEQELADAKMKAARYWEIIEQELKVDTLNPVNRSIVSATKKFKNQSELLRTLNSVSQQIVSVTIKQEEETIEYTY